LVSAAGRLRQFLLKTAAEARNPPLVFGRETPEVFEYGAVPGDAEICRRAVRVLAREDEVASANPGAEAEQRVRRAMRGAERDELLLTLEELSAWYRDLVVTAAGAADAAVHFDRLEDLRADATPERAAAAEQAAEIVRETWRSFEEFNVQPSLALEALFVRLRRVLATPLSWVAS